MKGKSKVEEWEGNLQEELEEIKNMGMPLEGIEANLSFSAGCAQFFTILCC